MARFAMAIDTARWVGCMDCVVACKTENGVPDGYCRDWITEEVRGAFPDLRMEIRSERRASSIRTATPTSARSASTA